MVDSKSSDGSLCGLLSNLSLSAPRCVDGVPLAEWTNLQESFLFDPVVVSDFVDRPEWRESTKKYRSLFDLAEAAVKARRLHACLATPKGQTTFLKGLLEENATDVIPTVGPVSAKLLSEHGIVQVRDLVDRYSAFLSSPFSFGCLCVFLRVDVGLDPHVYIRVALFAHIVCRFIPRPFESKREKP